jgi:Common central domain of tyrosinase
LVLIKGEYYQSFNASIMLFASLLVAAVFSQCTKVTTRYEVHDMTEADIKIFRETITIALTTPDPDSPNMSIWEAGANFHNTVATDIHNTAAFLFWHRLFLSSVEKKLQAINPDFYFPYWDSSREWNTYKNSRALRITDLPGLSLNRDLSRNRLTAPETLAFHFQTSISNGQGFEYYHRALEVVHGTVHVAVGGEMATMNSPRDPLFYVYHGNLDFEWAKCQAAWGTQYPQVGGKVRDDSTATLETMIPYFDNEFGDVLDISNLCISYAPFGTRRPAPQPPTVPNPTVTTASSTEAPVITSVIESTGTPDSSPETTNVPPVITTATVIITTATGIITTATGIETSPPNMGTPAVPPPPPPPKVDACPEALPESWIVMNNLNRTEIALAAAACEKVVDAVSKGETFEPAPVVEDAVYQEAVDAVLPEDYCVNPPSKPNFAEAQSGVPDEPTIYSGSERSNLFAGLFAGLLTILL